VRNIARAMITRFGMSENFPNYAPVDSEGHNIYSEETSTKIDKEIIKIIDQCTKETRKTVKLYKDKIEALASEVLKKETLNHQ
jgi:cell division protease FtsH